MEEKHLHRWEYQGKILSGNRQLVIGKYHFECKCGASIYAEKLIPGGATIVENDPHRADSMSWLTRHDGDTERKA